MSKINRVFNNKGITIVTLVVTIIVLMILAGISINVLIGENGVITVSKNQQRQQEINIITQKLKTKKIDVAKISENGDVYVDNYITAVKNSEEIEHEITKIDRIDEDVVYITIDNDYLYLLEEEKNGDLEITYEGEISNVTPRIRNLDVSYLNKNIEVKVRALRTDVYKFYIKEKGNSDYTLVGESTNGEYTYTELKENIQYLIKIEAINEKGQDKEERSVITSDIQDFDTEYKVIHQLMALDGTTFITIETENKKGIANTSVTPEVKKYEGFTSPEKQEVTIEADGSTTVTYKYTRNKYQYILGNAEGVSTTGSTETGIYYYGATIRIKAIVDSGYTWSKWTSSDTSLIPDQTTADTTFTMPDGKLTMTPNVIPNTYTVSYDKGTATGGTLPANQTATYNASITLGTNNMTKSNTNLGTVTFNYNGSGASNTTSTAQTKYTANGWTTTSGSTTRNYTNGQEFTYTMTSGLTLYPCFTQTAVSATFPTPTREGYTFDGWYTAASGGDKVTSYTGSSNVTYYAHWIANTYISTYNDIYKKLSTSSVDGSTWTHSNGEYVMTSAGGNGGYLSGIYNMLTDGLKYRIEVQAKASKSITVPMKFEAGGSKSIDLTTSYQTFYVDFTYNASATYKALTFYSANWESGDKLYIKDVKLSKIVTYDSTYGELYQPTKTGYTFDGWYTAASGGTKINTDTKVTITANQILYAHWIDNIAPNKPTITAKIGSSSGSTYTSGNWTNQNVYVTLSSSEDISGITKYEWKEGSSGTWKTTSLTTSNNVGTITFKTNRDSTIYFRATDGAGNISEESSIVIRKETTAPAVTITAKLVSSSGSTYISGTWTNKNVYVTLSSSEDVSGITKYEWKEGSSGTWKTTSLTTSNNVGTITFKTNRDSTIYFRATDGAGNISEESSIVIRKETTAPTVTIESSESSPTNASSITYTFTWSEEVTGFTVDDITVTNGTKGTFKTISSTEYTLVVTNSGSCAQSVSVATGVCIDKAGNSNTALSTKSVTIDRTVPTVTITANPSANPTNASSITYTFTWSEAVTGFTVDDVTVTNGTKGTFTANSSTVYTLVVTNSGSCAQSVSVAASKCTDAAGNNNTVSSTKSVTIDRTAPTLSSINVTSPTAGTYKEGQKVTIVAKYSENVYGSTPPVLKIKFGNSTERTATFSSGSGNTLTYTYTIEKGDNGTLETTSYSGLVHDKAENDLSVTNKTIGGYAIVADTAGPTITLTPSTTSSTNQNVKVTATFSDSSGILSKTLTCTGTSGTDYIANGTTDITIITNGQTVTAEAKDTLGNQTTVTSTFTNIDKISPSNATIDLSGTSTTTASSIKATVTHTDNQSGVNITNSKWVYNTISSAIGTNASSYTGGTFSSNSQEITLKATTPGTYYLHVLTVDKVGNVKETISSAVTVKQLVTGITLSKTSTTIVKGNTETITATVSPSNASNKNVTWSSSNTSVATVSGGKITAVAKGTATIKATAQDGSGKSASCEVTVQEAIAKVGSTRYGSVQAAIDKISSSGTVTMISNSTESNISIPSTKNITLDLNGKTLNAQIINNGTLTVEGEASGSTINKSDKAAIINKKGATLNIDSGTITSAGKGDGNVGATIHNVHGTVTIEGGTIEQTGDRNAIYNAGKTTIIGGTIQRKNKDAATINSTSEEGVASELYIEGGTISSDVGIAIIIKENTYVEISGGTIYSKGENFSAIVHDTSSSGQLTITGGNIYSEGGRYAIHALARVIIQGSPTIYSKSNYAAIKVSDGVTSIQGGKIFNGTTFNNPGSGKAIVVESEGYLNIGTADSTNTSDIIIRNATPYQKGNFTGATVYIFEGRRMDFRYRYNRE